MSYSDEELDRQGLQIRSKLALVFIPIFVICALIIFFQDNSISLNRTAYLESKNKEFSGLIASKREDGDYTRANRCVILKNGRKVGVSNEIYYAINAGDSVTKTKGADTIYFYLKGGKMLFLDYCKYPREKYLELLSK